MHYGTLSRYLKLYQGRGKPWGGMAALRKMAKPPGGGFNRGIQVRHLIKKKRRELPDETGRMCISKEPARKTEEAPQKHYRQNMKNQCFICRKNRLYRTYPHLWQLQANTPGNMLNFVYLYLECHRTEYNIL